MKGFKDYIEDDLGIFLNLDEFGELHLVNDKEVVCIFDVEDFREENIGKPSNRFGGTFTDLKVLFILDVDIKKPTIGGRVNVDGKDYTAINVDDTSKLYEITLQQYRF